MGNVCFFVDKPKITHSEGEGEYYVQEETIVPVSTFLKETLRVGFCIRIIYLGEETGAFFYFDYQVGVTQYVFKLLAGLAVDG